MGCDIHSFAEVQNSDGHWECVKDMHPFCWRSYSMFAFLAGVRNGLGIKPISEPRGLPDDCSNVVADSSEQWSGDGHTHSWLSVQELLDFDYDVVADRSVGGSDTRSFILNALKSSPQVLAAWQAANPPDDENSDMTYREVLSEDFFEDLMDLKDKGVGRIVFWFDN